MIWRLSLWRCSCGDNRPWPALSEAEGAVRSSEARAFSRESTALTRLRQASLLAHRFHSLQRQLQPLAAELGAGNDLLDVPEHLRITHFFAQFFQEGLNLRKYKDHFPTHCRLDEQLLTERTLKHERGGHAPISTNLAQPIVFLRARGPDNFQEIIGALRPELAKPPAARLAHFRLAAQIVELENQLGISCSRFLSHRFLRLFGSHRLSRRFAAKPQPRLMLPVELCGRRRHQFGRRTLIVTFFVRARDDRSSFQELLDQK